MKYVFFSMNDFEKEGGGTIRMLGIMNELSKQGNEVVFISNASVTNNFHFAIKHIPINYLFSRQDKRVFQGLLGILPISLINIKYAKFLNRLKEIFGDIEQDSKLYFFEYLDNSIGYWLKKNNLINAYINDLHGVATIEFIFQGKTANSVTDKIKFKAKAFIAELLDKKVFNNAAGLIFASRAMKDFYIDQYPPLSKKKNFVLPYVLSSNAASSVDLALKDSLIKKFNIKEDEKIFLFAGAFKKIGGVPDLITAYQTINSKNKNTRLLLIGDGPTFAECEFLIKKFGLEDKVYLAGRVSYNHLRTYQDLAHIIVCPDKQNMYSELIVHVKYLDALASGKLVIGGAFKSVKEINENERLSLMSKPSDIDSLAEVMQRSLDDYPALMHKYKESSSYTLENLNYAKFIDVLTRY
jgi:glycosyltransferase involved in cell wall biosynthesis